MRISYECTRGHVIEVYKGINDPTPKKCNTPIYHAIDGQTVCGAKLEWVPEPVAFTIK